MKTLSIKLVLFLCIYLSISSLSAQGNMYNEIAHYGQYFYDINATNTDITAAGDNIILNSQDEGTTWQEIKLPTNRAAIKHIAKIGNEQYVAAGNAIYITINDGKSWTIMEDMDDITSMKNFENTIIITREKEDQRFMRSDDGGLSWVTLSTSNATDPQNLDYINKDDAYFSDTTGTIYNSFNGGLSWSILNDNQFNEPIESLRFETVQHGYAQIGDIVWETLDGGNTWIEILDSFIASNGVYPLPSGLYTSSLTRFAYYNGSVLSYIQDDPEIDDLFAFDIAEANGKLYMCGTGMILVNDLNTTFEDWTDLTPGPDNGFNAMIIKGQKIIATGGRRMYISSDGGKTYEYEETNFSQIKDIALGPNGTIYNTQNGLQKSTNGGKDWEFLKSNTSLIHVFDDGRLIIYGGNKISLSTDDGSTFETLSDISPGLVYDLYFYDDNFGWLLNASGNSYRTTNGGVTWEAITFPFGSSPSKMHFIDTQNGFAVKRFSDKFWKTSDGGTTWEEINFSGGEADLLDVYFENNETGYVVGRENIFTEGIVFKTTDGGDSWEIFQKGINLFYEVTADETTGKVFVCGERGQLFSFIECDDATPTLSISNNRITCNESSEFYKWYLNDDFLVETTEPFIDYIDQGIYSVRIIGNNKCISDFSEGIDATVGTNDLIVSSFINIHPNPSNGIINLNVDSKYHLQSISVYSLSGNLVYMENGNSRKLNLSHLSSGSYFLRIQMQEGYSVEKIIIR